MPTKERLVELISLLEEMTTGGSTQLTLDEASDIHDCLESITESHTEMRKKWEAFCLGRLTERDILRDYELVMEQLA